jgi:hypothetical protein
MRVRDVDPKIKKLFPWSLFLTLALLFALGACSLARAADAKPSYTCEWVRDYLATHTEAEARAKAAELHLPKWLVRKAEKCT